MLASSIDQCQYRCMSIKPSRLEKSCCTPVLGAKLRRDDAEELATAFKAIADPGRLRLLNFIAAKENAEACVCELTEPLGLAQPTVSHHLRVLSEAGLLERERRGTWIFYRLVPERIEALRSVLELPAGKPRAKRSASASHSA